MFLKAIDGLRVIDPDRSDYLPDAGREVTLTSYWRRRLACGDVVEATDLAQSDAAPRLGTGKNKGA